MRSLLIRRLATLALTALLGAGAQACSFGNDYAVTVTWLINGAAPSESSCRANGVDRVRFTVLKPGKERVLEADCSARVRLLDGFDYGGFVSTRSFEYDVRYEYRVEMIDINGRPLEDVSYEREFDVRYGDDEPWVLTPLELFLPEGNLAGISAEWTIDGRKANPADCEHMGAVSVVIDVASSTDTYFDDYFEFAKVDCAAGTYVSRGAVLAEGEYYIRYAALDADDEVVQDLVAGDPYIVQERGTLVIDAVDFDLPVNPTR